MLHNKLFAFFAYETIGNGSTATATGLYETPTYLAAAPAGSNAAKYAAYADEAVTSTGQVATSCANSLGIADGPYCRTINGALDIGSPLKTALGSYDTTNVSKIKPGVGSRLDGIPDLILT